MTDTPGYRALGRVELPDPIDPGVAEQLPSTLFYRDGVPLKMFSALAYHPPAFNAVRLFSNTLGADSTLTMREREIVILRIATIVGCPYEWEMHGPLSAKQGWLSDTELRVLSEPRVGYAQADFSEREQALIVIAEEIGNTASLTDRSWNYVTSQLSVAEVVETIMWAGWYRVLAGLANGFAFAPDSPPA